LSNLSAKKKLVAQCIAGAMATEVLAAVMVGVSGTHGSEILWTQIFTAVVWLVWVVGFVNAFNFMDGMNGKSGLFTLNALVFGLLMMTLHIDNGTRESWFTQITHVPPASLAMPVSITIGGVGGFMVFNCRPRARVFLGDCG